MNNTLPRKAPLTLYKSFVRPHLNYGDIIYDQPNNYSFCNKLETVQYNTLAITGSVQETSKVKLYKELGLESFKSRKWFRCLCFFNKIKTFGLPSYLSNLISSGFHSYNTRNSEDVVICHCGTDNFKYSFFPWNILEWNNLDLTLRKSSYKISRNSLLKMIHPSLNPMYNIRNPLGLRLLTRLRLGLGYLNGHKFNHNFKNCVNPLCTCSLKIESTSHFFSTVFIITISTQPS